MVWGVVELGKRLELTIITIHEDNSNTCNDTTANTSLSEKINTALPPSQYPDCIHDYVWMFGLKTPLTCDPVGVRGVQHLDQAHERIKRVTAVN